MAEPKAGTSPKCAKNANMTDRREYYRIKQRVHRRKVKDEEAALRAELDVLQVQATELQHRWPALPPTSDLLNGSLSLSWQVIATAFRRQSKRGLQENSDLIAQINSNRRCILAMHSFTGTYMPRSFPLATPSWSQLIRHAALPSDPHARRVAKEWLTLHMYHNTDRVFSQLLSRPADATDLFVDCDVQFSQPHIIFTEYLHELLSFPMADVVHVLRHSMNSLWHFDGDQVTVEPASNTLYYRYRHPRDASWNLLQGYFHEADRCVMVFRRIEEDEVEPELRHRQKHVMEWVDIRRVTATTTSLRSFSLASQARTNDKYMSVDDVAAEFGIDLAHLPDDAAKVREVAPAMAALARDEYAVTIDRLVDELSCNMRGETRTARKLKVAHIR